MAVPRWSQSPVGNGTWVTSGPATVLFLLAKPEKPASLRGAAERGAFSASASGQKRRSPPAGTNAADGACALGGTGRGPLPRRGNAHVHGAGLCPLFRKLNAEVRELRDFSCPDSGAATGAKWRWTRPQKVVGTAPGSGEASVKPRGSSKTTKCGLSPGPPCLPNTPTGWISGSSSSSTWYCFSSCIFCHGEWSECKGVRGLGTFSLVWEGGWEEERKLCSKEYGLSTVCWVAGSGKWGSSMKMASLAPQLTVFGGVEATWLHNFFVMFWNETGWVWLPALPWRNCLSYLTFWSFVASFIYRNQ